MGLWLLRGSRRMSALASVAAGVLSACGQPTPPEPETLRLLQIRPENPLGVYLDEELVLHFSAPVDPTSVTHASLQVVDTAGRAARGRIVVEGAQVRFEPAPVLSATLVDGGFAPATDYELRVLGFPALDGVRSVEGAPLSTSVRLSLRTVQPGVDRRAFRPRLEERPRPLRFFPGPSADGRWPMGPLDSIYLDCDAPLDPSTIVDANYELVDEIGRTIAVRARVLENAAHAAVRARPNKARLVGDADAWRREPRAALLELTPLSPLAPGRYSLRLVPRTLAPRLNARLNRAPLGLPVPLVTLEARDTRPLDTSGRVVWDRAVSAVTVTVLERGWEGPRNLVAEDFLDTRLRSPVAVEADGTAAWRGDGRVSVRFPAAAGDGRAGELVLSDRVETTDIHSVRLVQPAGMTTRLPSQAGPVVLRTQGSLRVAGNLVRQAGAGSLVDPARVAAPDLTLSLSAWLQALQVAPAAPSSNWTVLVAGGDLIVEGRIAVSTPLLLVAGGMIRISGEVQAGGEDQILRLGDGGGAGVMASVPEWLVLDEPLLNPLRQPLTWAVRSGPIPQRGVVREWLWGNAFGSSPTPRGSGLYTRPGSGGTWRVRWIGLGAGQPARLDPRFVTPPGPLQLQIELTVQPGGVWDPPWVDRVEAAFEEQP